MTSFETIFLGDLVITFIAFIPLAQQTLEPEFSSSPVVQIHQLGEKKLQFNIDDAEQDENVDLVKNPGRIIRSTKILRC